MVAVLIRSRIEEFRPCIPLIHGLKTPGMRSCHWEMLSERIHKKVRFQPNLTLSHCLEIGLQNYLDEIAQVAELAGKVYIIEQVELLHIY